MLKECIIIGGGPAGIAAARAAAKAGLKKILIIERDSIGGTCTNRGCIPTKFLLARSAALATCRIPGDRDPPDWSRTLLHKNALVQGLSRSQEAACRAEGIEVVRGAAQFVGSHEVAVLKPDGTRCTCNAAHFVVAAGSRPAELPAAPCNGSSIITSDQALNLDPLPRSLAIVGSGPVGAEFAFIFTRLGVNVTLIEGEERLFPAEDEDVHEVFRKVYERLGVAVTTGDAVRAIEPRRNGSSVAVSLASGAIVETEKALVAIGRALESRALNLDAAGVPTGKRGEILVDEMLRTAQPHIFAAGDVTGRLLLAHAATRMGELAGRAAAGGQATSGVPYHSIPWATFTTPEVAGVGLSLHKALHSGFAAVAARAAFLDNVKSRIDRETEGFVKIVADRATGTILGGTIVSAHAADLIHVLALVVHRRMTVTDMADLVFAHPSTAETFVDAIAALKSTL